MISITLTTSNGILSVDESAPAAVPPILPTLLFTAAVGGDTANKGVTWTLAKQSACSGTGTGPGQCGTITNTTPFTVTYTPPSNLSAAISVVLTATSVADNSVTKTATIMVVLPVVFTTTTCNPPSPPLTVACVLPGGNNGVAYSTSSAPIAFTGGVEPYTVTSTSTSPTTLSMVCLTLTSSTTGTTASITGKPCNTGVAPITVTFTVTVADSGGAPSVMQPYSITLQPAPPLSITTTSLPSGFSNLLYTASITANGGVAPLTWTISPMPSVSLPPGLAFNPANGQISGIPTAQAPAGSSCTPFQAGTYCFTVQVQDSALPNPQVAPTPPLPPLPLSITILKPLPLSITTASLPSGTTATGYGGSLQATGGVGPYTWTVTQGQLPAGLTLSTLNGATGSITGTPVIAAKSTFTVQVTDSETIPAEASAQFSIAITAGANNNLLFKGSYSFLFTGFDTGGSVAIAGSITADGAGHITTGTEDSNRTSGVAVGGSVTTGTYTIDAKGDGRGIMEITAQFGASGPLTVDYDLVLDSNGNIRFFEDNSTKTSTDSLQTHGEGIMKPVQGSGFGSASFSGNYAFVFAGQDVNTPPMPAAFGGVIHANGGGTLAPGMSDFNDGGTFSSGSLSGDYSFIGGSRGEAAMTFPTPTGQPTLTFIFYFVSPSDMYFIEVDNSTTTPGKPTVDRLAGEMILQQPSTSFNSGVLQGVSVASGIGVSSSNSDVFAGLLTAPQCDGSTPVTFSYDENNAGTVMAPSFTGTCTMGLNGNGRASFAGLGSSAAQTRIAAAYLTGPGSGFLLGSDAAVTTGILEQQSSNFIVSDAFERPNGGVGANWTPTEGAFSITSDAISLSSQGGDSRGSMYWNAATFPNDQFSQITIGAVGGSTSTLGPAVRMQNSGENYYMLAAIGTTVNLQVESAGANSTIGVYNHQIVPGDVLRLEVQGTTLTAKLNGTTILTETDSTFASGSAGIAGLNTTSPTIGGDWVGGPIVNLASVEVDTR